jgi:hypothetical protein
MSKGNSVSAIKAYFAHPQSFAPEGKPLAQAANGEKSELMALGAADKAFFRQLGEFCVAECDRLGISY